MVIKRMIELMIKKIASTIMETLLVTTKEIMKMIATMMETMIKKIVSTMMEKIYLFGQNF